jgi:hypothetical protein
VSPSSSRFPCLLNRPPAFPTHAPPSTLVPRRASHPRRRAADSTAWPNRSSSTATTCACWCRVATGRCRKSKPHSPFRAGPFESQPRLARRRSPRAAPRPAAPDSRPHTVATPVHGVSVTATVRAEKRLGRACHGRGWGRVG